MNNMYDLLKWNEEEKLKKLYLSSHLNQFYWLFENEYSKTLEFAIERINDKSNYHLANKCENFIHYFLSLNLKKPSDILLCTRQFKSENVLILLDFIFKSSLIERFLMFSLYKRETVISSLPYGDWVEIIGRKYLQLLLEINDDLLEVSDLFPANIPYSNLYKEYMLSWSYEENRLSLKAKEYFKEKHTKKYVQLEKLNS